MSAEEKSTPDTLGQVDEQGDYANLIQFYDDDTNTGARDTITPSSNTDYVMVTKKDVVSDSVKLEKQQPSTEKTPISKKLSDDNGFTDILELNNMEPIIEPKLAAYLDVQCSRKHRKTPEEFSRRWVVYRDGYLHGFLSEKDIELMKSSFSLFVDDAAFTIPVLSVDPSNDDNESGNNIAQQSNHLLVINVFSNASHQLESTTLKFSSHTEMIHWLTELQRVTEKRAAYHMVAFRRTLGLAYKDSTFPDSNEKTTASSIPTFKEVTNVKPILPDSSDGIIRKTNHHPRILSKAANISSTILQKSIASLQYLEKMGGESSIAHKSIYSGNVGYTNSDDKITMQSSLREALDEIDKLKSTLKSAMEELDASRIEADYFKREHEIREKQDRLKQSVLKQQKNQKSAVGVEDSLVVSDDDGEMVKVVDLLEKKIRQVSQLEYLLEISQTKNKESQKIIDELTEKFENQQIEVDALKMSVVSKDEALMKIINDEAGRNVGTESEQNEAITKKLNESQSSAGKNTSASHFYTNCDALANAINQWRSLALNRISIISRLNSEVIRIAEESHSKDVACRLIQQQLEDNVCKISHLEHQLALVKSRSLSLIEGSSKSIQKNREKGDEKEGATVVDDQVEKNETAEPHVYLDTTESIEALRTRRYNRADSLLEGKCRDRYGFEIPPERLNVLLSAENAALENEASVKEKAEANSLMLVKWTTLMERLSTDDLTSLQKNVDMKTLIRYGVPYQYRAQVWLTCIQMQLKDAPVWQSDHRRRNYYTDLLAKQTEPRYQRKLAYKEIELDLQRTMPENVKFESASSEGIPKLRRVLRAYSDHNPGIGYCQGFNRIAAIALLVLPEEDAFWCLMAIVEKILPANYYNNYLAGAHTDQKVFRDLVNEKIPQVGNHFTQLDLDISLFTFSWFVTIFVDNFSSDITFTIWDAFLFEGSKVLFRWALACLKLLERDILKYCDYIHLNEFMRLASFKISEMPNVVNELRSIAYTSFGLPFRTIQKKRAMYLRQVQSELVMYVNKRADWAAQHDPSGGSTIEESGDM